MEKRERQNREDRLFDAAEEYRHAEQNFLYNVHNILYLQELDDAEITRSVAYHPHQYNTELWVEAVNASVMHHKMQKVAKDHDLVIGGIEENHRVGEIVIFDPSSHMPFDDPYDSPMRKGDSAIIEMAQISVMKEGQEDVILLPVVSHHKSNVSSPIQEGEKAPATQPSNELRR